MTQPILSIVQEGRTPVRVHFLGVAGSGMSGLAWLFLAQGHKVSGSDRVRTKETDKLEAAGLKFSAPHTERCVDGADLVIHSSAVKTGNPAFDEANRQNIPLVRRAEALAALMARKKGVVIAGTHGKTTTSSLSAWTLRQGGVSCSHYVGAEIPILGSNAHWEPDNGWFVAEGDESDGTVALFHPEISVILNIEEEHLDFYSGLEEIEAVFQKLMDQTRGTVIYCGDNAVATRLAESRPNAVSYGTGPNCRFRAEILETRADASRFRVTDDGRDLGEVTLGIPGLHNVTNAMAVVALASTLEIPFEKTAAAMRVFRGAKRRFDVRHRDENFTVVDDYGHHPTEVKATLQTARSVAQGRVLVVFQPHRYSRTQLLKDDFGSAFDQADEVYVLDIYAASEKPLPGVSGETLVEAMKAHGHKAAFFTPSKAEALAAVGRSLRSGDLALTLGAGDVHEITTRLAEILPLHTEALALVGPETRAASRLFEPMSKHTTIRVGGPARYWHEPRTEQELAALVQFFRARSIPVFLLGRGSNLLVRDGGLHGAVICPDQGVFVEASAEKGQVRAGAGVKMKRVAALAKTRGLGGLEWMDGIPGNVGGSTRMNAGAMGSEMFDHIVSVRYLDLDGVVREKKREEIAFSYRSVPEFKDRCVLSVLLQAEPAPPDLIQTRLLASMDKRKTSQPIAASAGCIFKNPGEIQAGKLVDELGCKGDHEGSARVSTIHGNFIVNEGGATAKDVIALIQRIQEKARTERGIILETEVQIVGEVEL